MCGISGVISNSSLNPYQLSCLGKMNASLVHRGPDGKGDYIANQVAFAMRRLSVIDLEGGGQPLFNEDKTIALVANGEVYNYIELTDSLKIKGHSFLTHSDCETIIHLYEEYGEDFIHHLRGMYAFSLHDQKKNLVYIVRDRMGEKPLYYFKKNDFLLFSSEMKSLLSSTLVPFEFDSKSVYDYFHYQFVPEPRTPLKDVKKLPAGHLIKIDLNGLKIEEKCYWRMEDAKPVAGDPATLIREELERISEIIIRSDVPVGVALSGGLDSSSIAALAVKKYPGTLHAFSVGYPGRPSNDEREEAKQLADILGIPIHEVELDTKSLVENFEKMNFFRDDPIADISGYGYYAINEAARKNGISVLLQGQGGDELFWGYKWVKDAVGLTEKSIRYQNFLYGFGIEFLKNLPSWRNHSDVLRWVKSFGRIRGSFRKYLKFKAPKNRAVFYELSPDFRMATETLDSYLTNEFKNSLKNHSPYDLFSFDKPWKYTDVLITKLISDTYLLENGIAQGDRLSMAFSVELRLPLIDYKLVELVIGLRKNNQKHPDHIDFPKPWLRAAMKGVLSEEIMNRPKKGFAPPVLEWHNELFKVYGHQLLNGELVKANILTKESALQLSTGPFPDGAICPISFKALVLENWARQMKAQMQSNLN